MNDKKDGTSPVRSNDSLSAWVRDTTEAIKKAGFTVTEYQGFPLIEIPMDHLEGVRLLKLPLPHGGVKTMYAEGMLVTPFRVAR